jgi:putative ABC transport system permease protein
MFIKISPGDISSTLNNLKKVWDQRVTHRPFEYHFLDEDYEALYKTEQRTGEIFTTFSALAILLACLGLFALAAFAITRRTKEIGIRKVLGASVPGIMRMLSQDFLKLILIAAVLTFPIAWWAMHKWLMDFAYRVTIGWWVFVVAAMAAMLIALIAISFHSIKAAIANPVKSLRTE